MQLKINENIKAAVEVNGALIINIENSTVYDNIENNEAYIYIRAYDGTEIKIRFVKTTNEQVEPSTNEQIDPSTNEETN